MIYVPVLEEMFRGGRGQGATLNGQPIRVTERFDLSTGLLRRHQRPRACPARRPASGRSGRGGIALRSAYGSGAMMLAYVAAGRLVGYCEPRMSVWDRLAAYALIEAAGGRVAAISNGAMKGKPLLGATRRDYERLAALTRFDATGAGLTGQRFSWPVPLMAAPFMACA